MGAAKTASVKHNDLIAKGLNPRTETDVGTHSETAKKGNGVGTNPETV